MAEPVTDPEQAASWRRRHHDLHQPLNAIGLFCAALRARPLASAEQGMVQGISEAAAALERMVEAWAAEDTPPELAPGLPQDTPAAVLDRGAPEHVAETGTPVPAWRPRVLIVDDDPASRTSMAMLIESWDPGVEVSEFGHLDALEDFLAQPHGQPPVLCIIDYHLSQPGEGMTALGLLRRAWQQHRLNAAILTGDGQAARSLRLAEPTVDVFVKPVDAKALIGLIERALSEQRT